MYGTTEVQPSAEPCLGVHRPMLPEEGQSLPGVLDGELRHPREGSEGSMRRNRDHAHADGARAGGGVPVAMRAAGKLAVVEVEGDHALEHALVGQGVGETLARRVCREIEAGRVEVARVDEKAEAVGRLRDAVIAEAPGVAQHRLVHSHAFLAEEGGDGGERRIDGQADAHAGQRKAGRTRSPKSRTVSGCPPSVKRQMKYVMPWATLRRSVSMQRSGVPMVAILSTSPKNARRLRASSRGAWSAASVGAMTTRSWSESSRSAKSRPTVRQCSRSTVILWSSCA